jgi:peptidoglycan/LPS O-acetylase OafA/YrhL
VFHDIFHHTIESFSMRLLDHLRVYHVNAGPAMRGLFTSIFGLAVTMLLAWPSFRFYESRFLELKERWTIRRPRSG